jgi:hypothetical protein
MYANVANGNPITSTNPLDSNKTINNNQNDEPNSKIAKLASATTKQKNDKKKALKRL